MSAAAAEIEGPDLDDLLLRTSRTFALAIPRLEGPLRREVTVAAPQWTYPAGMQAADGVALPFEIHVAQFSASFGPGPFRRIVINV